MLQIKDALRLYNESHDEKMSLGDLADKVIERDITPGAKRSYLSHWINGKNYGKLTPDVILRICEVTQVTPNFLFNYKTKNDARKNK